MASEPHAISCMECPVTVCISKVYLVNEEAHGKRSAPAEVIILIPDMDVLDVHLDSIEEVGDE